MSNVGFATLGIIPTAKDFAKNLLKEIAPGLDKGADESGKQYGEKFSAGALGKIGAFAKGGAAVAGAAIIGGLVTAMGQQDVSAGLQASLGLTPDVSAKFGAAAGLAYKQNYGESVEQLGDTIKVAFQSGIVGANDSKEAIAGVVAQIETYSKVSGEDATAATRAVSQMLKTGLAKNATEAFDILTRGQQLGINKSEDLLDTFNEYGVQFQKLGLDGPKALGLMNQAIQAGARDSDVAADALKEFSIRAVDGSKSSAAGFEALGLNAQKMTETFAKGGPQASAALQLVFDRLKSVKDPAAQSAAAVNLFGTQAEDLGKALLAMDPKSAAAGLGEVAGATDRANKALGSTPTAQIQSFTRTLKQGFVDLLGGKVLPALQSAAKDFKSEFGPAISDVVTKVRDASPAILSAAQAVIGNLVPAITTAVSAVSTIVKWLGDHDTVAKALAITVGTLAVALGTYKTVMSAIAFAGFVKGLLEAAKASKAYTVAQWLMNSALLASPITWIVLGIAAVVAGIVFLATKTQFFQTIWSKSWGVIQSAASAVWSWLQSVWPTVETILTGPIVAAKTLISKAWDLLKAGASAVLSGVTSAFKAVVKYFSDMPGNISRALGSAVTYLVAKGKDFVTGLYNGVVGAAVSLWTWWNNLSATIHTKIGNAASSLVQKGKDFLSGLYNGVKSGAVSAFTFFSNLPGELLKKLGNVGSLLREAGGKVISGFIDGLKSKFGDVKNTLGDLTGKLTSWKGPPARDAVLLTPAGQSIIDGLISGFESRYGAVKSSLGGLTERIAGLPVASASQSGAFANARDRINGARPVEINVNGANDPEATARIVGRKLAGAGV